jgi:cytochrome d ubiquinol oxidase subunit II
MPPAETLVALVMLAVLALYALTGGADFGGGVWDLLATGPRAAKQRDVIARAIGPIWEANHVWLIVVAVLLFVCFPLAFAAIATALHLPLLAMLLGVVFRGSAFAFRSHVPGRHAQRRWSVIFAVASVVTPVALGVCAGAIASGAVRVDGEGRVLGGFFASWMRPFPWTVGVFTLTLFAYLAAVYLTLEPGDAELRDDFRRRALITAFAVGAMALVSLLAAARAAPVLHDGLTARPWSLPFHLVTGAAAVGAIAALAARRYPIARALAVVQVGLIVCGWGLAQYPWLVPPDLPLDAAAAPERTLWLTLAAVAAGAVVLIPALIWLFRVFKGTRATA